MEDAPAEALALIAAAITRSVGVTVGDLHLGMALAMLAQLRQERPRRTAKSIKALNRLMPDRRDRSLATAFPAIYLSSFARTNVCVMVSHAGYAYEDATLYRTILAELGSPTKVTVNAVEPAAVGQASILVATPEALLQLPGHRALMIVRLTPDATKRVVRGMPGSAALPDL